MPCVLLAQEVLIVAHRAFSQSVHRGAAPVWPLRSIGSRSSGSRNRLAAWDATIHCV